MPKAAFTPGQHVAGQQGARSGYILTVSRQHNYYNLCYGRLVSLCIQQQTGNNIFVADTRMMLTV